jgi:1-phosphofructokinase
MADVMIFAPSPLLTVTIEDDAGGPELHVHAGGQGVWQARMLRTFGRTVSMCVALAGETGFVVRHLLQDDGVEVHAVLREGRGAAYVHDRRAGERVEIAEVAGEPLTRHDLDELYALALREALEARVVVLSGPANEGILPDDVYRRLAADLSAAGKPPIVDLSGTRLTAALEGGVRLVKVSDDELHEAGEAGGGSVPELVAAARRIRDAGAKSVVVSRAGTATLVIDGDSAVAVNVPVMEAVDPRGAGDSFTAALVSALLDDEPLTDAVALGVAAGALNVTRHGLGSGDAEAIRRLRGRVTVEDCAAEEVGSVTPGQLAAQVEEEVEGE